MSSQAPAGRARSSRPHRWFVVALALGLLLAVVAPVMADASTQPGSAATAGAGVPQINWTACGLRLECARVPVPLDWRQPDGPTITLSVIRHLASHPEQRIGSLFFNPGGPGDSGVAAVANRGEALDAMTGGRFDIVGWDIRGSAGSAPVTCFADASERAAFWEDLPVPTTRAEQRRYLAKTIELAQRCGERNGELLAHISTADTARDLDHLRWLVGDRKLSYLGESFGTLIGQTYPTCSRDACVPWPWTACSIRSPPRRAPPRCWPAAWPTPTGCSASSCGCARWPARTAARWPGTVRRRLSGPRRCWRGCAIPRSRPRRPPRPGS